MESQQQTSSVFLANYVSIFISSHNKIKTTVLKFNINQYSYNQRLI